MPVLAERLRQWWDRLRGRGGPRPPGGGDVEPPDEPALVGSRPRGPRPSLSAEAVPPEPYEFDDHAEHPRSTDE